MLRNIKNWYNKLSLAYIKQHLSRAVYFIFKREKK